MLGDPHRIEAHCLDELRLVEHLCVEVPMVRSGTRRALAAEIANTEPHSDDLFGTRDQALGSKRDPGQLPGG